MGEKLWWFLHPLVPTNVGLHAREAQTSVVTNTDTHIQTRINVYKTTERERWNRLRHFFCDIPLQYRVSGVQTRQNCQRRLLSNETSVVSLQLRTYAYLQSAGTSWCFAGVFLEFSHNTQSCTWMSLDSVESVDHASCHVSDVCLFLNPRPKCMHLQRHYPWTETHIHYLQPGDRWRCFYRS